MINKETINDITSRISETIENSPLKDLEKNMKAVASSVFDRMDLVSKDQLENSELLLQHVCVNLAELEDKIEKHTEALNALLAYLEAQNAKNADEAAKKLEEFKGKLD